MIPISAMKFKQNTLKIRGGDQTTTAANPEIRLGTKLKACLVSIKKATTTTEVSNSRI